MRRKKFMFNFSCKILLVILSLLVYGQASATCNISFTAAAGANSGQVTFEPADSQYSGQRARYKYTFTPADDVAGNGINGIYDANRGFNQGVTGVTTDSGAVFAKSSQSTVNNVLVHSKSNDPLNPSYDYSAFYYEIPTGLSDATDNFLFYDGNDGMGQGELPQSTVTVTIPVQISAPGAPTSVTATAIGGGCNHWLYRDVQPRQHHWHRYIQPYRRDRFDKWCVLYLHCHCNQCNRYQFGL